MKFTHLIIIILVLLCNLLHAQIGWVGNIFPNGGTITQSESFTIYIQVYKAGVTEPSGQGGGIDCEIYYGMVDAFGGSWMNIGSIPMAYNVDIGNNDEYSGTISGFSAGLYEYKCRCTDDGGSNFLFNTGNNSELIVESTVPVRLASFNAIQSDQSIQLSWKTSSEINNEYFTLKKEIKDRWETIATIPSYFGRSGTSPIYEYLDTNPHPGINTFSLSQTDNDGTSSELEVINVFYTSHDHLVYPNPVSDVLNIHMKDLPDQSKLVISNALGQKITETAVSSDVTPIDVSNLPFGNYTLTVIDPRNRVLLHTKFIVE